MTGERLGWFQVASHLSIPVTELRQRISFREFVDWITFLRREEERETKQDIYLAQIACEVRRGYVAEPRTVKLKDLMLTSSTEEPAKEEAPRAKSKSRSKAAWTKALGVKSEER